MASSNASLDPCLFTRVLLLLLLLLGCFRPSSSAAARLAERWRNPCLATLTIGSDIATTSTDEFERLSRRSTDLKQLVSSLKNDYVHLRFGDEIGAEDAKYNSGFVITGSPSWSDSSDDISQTLLTCYENLARLAVLTQLTREGEQTEPQNPNFATRFTSIEDHPEAGLYAIMCNLRAVLTSEDIETMSPEVASVRLEEVSDSGQRHVRDYMVLRVLEDSADKLSSRFDRLVGRAISQITPSTVQ